MEERFASVLLEVLKGCEAINPLVQEIKVYLTQLSVSIKEDADILLFNQHQADIITHSTLAQVFQWLSLTGFWNFLNYYLLKKLVDKFGDTHLKEIVEGYGREVDAFKSSIKLVDFLPVWSGRSPHQSGSGLEPIILRVNRDWPTCTLADIGRIEGYLESRFMINRFILNFANAGSGSVVVMWLVSSHVIPFLKKRIMAIGSQSLTEEGVIEISFGPSATMKVRLIVCINSDLSYSISTYLGITTRISSCCSFSCENK